MSSHSLKRLDFDLLDYIFEMGGGYVLDFSNQTFSEFFNDELGIDIDDYRYCDIGKSKGKRLRSYLRQSRTEDILRVLNSLWEYRETKRRRSGQEEERPELIREFFDLLVRLGGKVPTTGNKASFIQYDETIDEDTAKELLRSLMELAALEPHPRGYAFETFLKRLSLSVNLVVHSAISPFNTERGRFGQRYATLFPRAESCRAQEAAATT